jgi:hypothetical protein
MILAICLFLARNLELIHLEIMFKQYLLLLTYSSQDRIPVQLFLLPDRPWDCALTRLALIRRW